MMFKYHWRSLVMRRARTLLTAAGVGLAVFVAMVLLGLAQGIAASFRATGNPLNVLVTSRGAETIEFSAVDRSVYEVLRHAPEAVLASPEILFAATQESGGRISQALVRGVLPVAGDVHDQVRVTEGRLPAAGDEIALGPLVAVKLGLPNEELSVGQTLVLDGVTWKIVGRFEAPGTAFEAEIWAPLDRVMAAYRKEELNAVVLRAKNEEALDELLFDLDTRRDVVVAARRETDYYAAHAEAFRPISAAINIMAALLTLGGALIGMNTLFASVTSRTRELGMLRTLGFRRFQLAAGFAFEGVLPALLGSLLAIGAVLLMQGFALRLPMGAFRLEVGPGLLGAGLLLGLAIGLLGSVAAVVRTLRLSTIEAIRHL
ncbi:MAG: ABC transporter permease [Terrimicrobiaceae bacterium]|nr:ABC transporter permease [Terrimicrobiaceae bacterium]